MTEELVAQEPEVVLIRTVDEKIARACPADREFMIILRDRAEKAEEELAKCKKPRQKRLPKQEEEAWVPFRKLFKATKVPKLAADVIRQALEAMKCEEIIGEKNLWQAIEFWAADYLAGAQVENGKVQNEFYQAGPGVFAVHPPAGQVEVPEMPRVFRPGDGVPALQPLLEPETSSDPV